MTFLFLLCFVAAYAAAALYLKKAREYLELSAEPWNRLYEAAESVVSDPTMPERAARFAAAAVICAGCGCVTRRILWDSFTGRLMHSSGTKKPFELNPEQDAKFSRVVMNAIYYDSLRAPFSGFLLRRLVMPWLRAASQSKDAMPQVVRGYAASSRKAIAHKKEGQRILVNA